MTIDPRTPVIVGVGRSTCHPAGDPTMRPEPVDVMVRALVAAGDDCSGGRPGGGTAGGAPVGRRLLDRLDSLRILKPLSWDYSNPGLLVADQLHLDPRELGLSASGGNGAQRLVHRTALAIGAGELDVAVIAGADCGHSLASAKRHPDRPVLPWTVQPVDTPRPVVFGDDQRPTTDAEVATGLALAIHVYPLFENALRSAAGRGVAEHRADLGALWARFSQVGASNPFAWLPDPLDAEDIMTVSPSNPMVAEPYTALMVENDQVDQGAALIVCSADAAREAGVPLDRWVFPLAGSDADDHWYLSHRADFASSPALGAAGRSVLGHCGATIDHVAHLDLYSNFPASVEIAADELGLDCNDPNRPLTVTGGLTFSGAPGNAYGAGAIAAMVGALREDPGSLGLVTGVGGYLTAHSVGLYGTAPSQQARPAEGRREPEPGVHVETAGGFWWADPSAAVAALPQCSPDADARGEITVETYSVSCNPDGSPTRAVVACHTIEGRRTWATVTDQDQLAILVAEEGCGRLGVIRDGGSVDLS